MSRTEPDAVPAVPPVPPVPPVTRRPPWLAEIATTLGAVVLAFLVGAVLMVLSDPSVNRHLPYLFTAPGMFTGAAVEKVGAAYGAMLNGALGGWSQLTETTAQAAPLICAGLGVGLAFRAGLFNIGAQGQAVLGAILAAWVGFGLHLPLVVHCALAVLAGVVGGAIWGGIVGVLKARTGAHEVIVTIMMNTIAAGLLAWLLTTDAFRRPGRSDPVAPVVDWNATFARMVDSRLHLGFLLALLAAAAVWWLLERSTWGFAIKAVGSNPDAARTAGINAPLVGAATMTLAGALAGLAGAQAVLAPSIIGTPPSLSAGVVGSVGFDAITVALLGRSRPVGIVLAGLLFGALHAGGQAMQAVAQTPLTLTLVLQALIVLFVAAPALVRGLAPWLRRRRTATGSMTGGASAGALS